MDFVKNTDNGGKSAFDIAFLILADATAIVHSRGDVDQGNSATVNVFHSPPIRARKPGKGDNFRGIEDSLGQGGVSG